MPVRWPAVIGTELAEISAFLLFSLLANTLSPGLGPQDSWTPAGERKTEAPPDQFDKYRGEDEKMDPLDQSGVGGIWRQSVLV